MFLLKFHQNRTATKNYFFEEGGGGGESDREGTPDSKFYYNLLGIGKHMKMLCFEFQQNYTINEQFDFFEEMRGAGGEGWREGELHF